MSHNPLIDYPDLPPFSEIRPEHVKPAVEQLVEAGRERIRKVLADGDFSYRALELTLAEGEQIYEFNLGSTAPDRMQFDFGNQQVVRLLE